MKGESSLNPRQDKKELLMLNSKDNPILTDRQLYSEKKIQMPNSAYLSPIAAGDAGSIKQQIT